MTSPRARIDRLILIYDARSGRLAAVIDSVRKALGAGACSLCAITHGLTGEKPAWSACRTRLGVPVDALHRDEMPDELRELVQGALPAVVADVGRRRVVLLGPRELATLGGSVEAFESAVTAAATARGLALAGA